ncbi:hypothetical protein ATANTOWER_004673 [Ataeniobius toweri]|uniref:Uncharacterized protein n=1 Tax=Ataeniobius toweri TaxID=208326 RepID=A0ABU7C8Q6_9TELE|nr:hypothetical protein [Ataeniobius toweri]
MMVFKTRLDFGPSVKMTAGRTESCQDKDLADNTYRLKRTERSVYVFFRWKDHRGETQWSGPPTGCIYSSIIHFIIYQPAAATLTFLVKTAVLVYHQW